MSKDKKQFKQYKKYSVDEFLAHYNKWLEFEKTNPNVPFMKSGIELKQVKGHESSKGGITYYMDVYVVTDFNKSTYELFDISFQGILTFSGAKLPPNTPPDKAEHMQVKFSDIDEEFLKGTSVKAESYQKVIEACTRFIDTLDLFDTENKKIYGRVMSSTEWRDELGIAEAQAPEFHTIKQFDRKPNDVEKKAGQRGKIMLKNPIYSIKLMSNKQTRKFVYEGEKFTSPKILNMRERTKEGIFPEYLLNGESLHMGNVDKVVRHKSIIAGVIRPTSNYSKFGLSFALEFNKLVIYPGPISAQGTELANRISDLTDDFDMQTVDEPDIAQTPQVSNMPITTSMTDSGEPDTNLMNLIDEKGQAPTQKNQNTPVASVPVPVVPVASVPVPVVSSTPVVASVQVPVASAAAPRQQRNMKFGNK